jgi:hypothetical protein
MRTAERKFLWASLRARHILFAEKCRRIILLELKMNGKPIRRASGRVRRRRPLKKLSLSVCDRI